MAWKSYEQVKAELLSRPDFDRAAYDAEGRRLEQRQQLGHAIRAAREAAALTQAALARELGTTQPAIARLEAGMVDPKLSTLERLVAVLGREIVISATGITVAA